jgi:hypothetical protein
MTTLAMTVMKRVVVTQKPTGYKEVSLEFRKLRTSALEAARVQERTNRIHCPVLDAARTSGAYGTPALTTCDQQGMERFAEGIKLTASKLATIGYMSGPWYKIMSNKWNQTFDDSEVNTGFVKSLKHDVHTGIISSGQFDQAVLNEFVWNLFPELKDANTSIDKTFLQSSKADDLFVTSKHLGQIMDFNESKSESPLKGMGSKVSRFEMETLLLGRLGQEINLDSETVRAISVRDLHDLYKYGVFPAPQEDDLRKEGLIQDWSLAMSGQTFKIMVKDDSATEASF